MSLATSHIRRRAEGGLAVSVEGSLALSHVTSQQVVGIAQGTSYVRQRRLYEEPEAREYFEEKKEEK